MMMVFFYNWKFYILTKFNTLFFSVVDCCLVLFFYLFFNLWFNAKRERELTLLISSSFSLLHLLAIGSLSLSLILIIFLLYLFFLKKFNESVKLEKIIYSLFFSSSSSFLYIYNSLSLFIFIYLAAYANHLLAKNIILHFFFIFMMKIFYIL